MQNIADKKTRRLMHTNERLLKVAAEKALDSEILLTQEAGYLQPEGLERTWKFQQREIKKHVDITTSKKMFELKLPELGPYYMDYTRNGRHMLIGGGKGHIASFDWKQGKIECELQVRETVRDVKWLHNETMFAVAQKKYTYLYDKTGLELHCLKEHIEATGNAGYLKYQDTSTGQLVAEHRTKLGSCSTMIQNPWNAIMNLGHANGCVTMWSPNMSQPLVKMHCHQGPIQSLAIDLSGNYMASAGLDGHLKVWDVRTYKELHSYFTPKPAHSLAFSHKGMLAVGHGPRLTVWKDIYKTKQSEPYMTHLIAGSRVTELKFCPFEDILGCGHQLGISSLVVPGSGEPNFDTMEANPNQTTSQRQESEVHNLLDKIQPDMITLDTTRVGKVDRAPTEVIAQEARKEWEANHPGKKFVPQKRARGKSSSMRRYLRKQGNVIDGKRVELIESLEKQKKERKLEREKAKPGYVEKPKSALDRFNRQK